MRRQRRHKNHGCCRRYDWSTGRQTVAGRSSGCGNNDTICLVRIQIGIIDIIIKSYHTQRAFSADDNIIQSDITVLCLSFMNQRTEQHHSFFNRKTVTHQPVQCRIDGILIDLCQITQSTHIDTKQRNLQIYHIPGRLKKRSVSPKHDDTLRPPGNPLRVCIGVRLSFFFLTCR